METRLLRSRRRPTRRSAASQPRPDTSDEVEREHCAVFAYDAKALWVRGGDIAAEVGSGVWRAGGQVALTVT